MEIINETEKSNREESSQKPSFLAQISHDLRTSLSAITGCVALMKTEENTASVRDCIDVIERSTSGALTLINDIMDLARIESGHFTLKLRPVPLKETLQNCVRVLQSFANPKSLKVSLKIEDELPAWVNADAERLSQVILNLGVNAIKFTENGGVTIVAKPIQSGRLRIEVHDTGIGIANAEHNLVFEPFYQVPSSREQVQNCEKGSGLGLAICRGIVELMNGKIDFESEPNFGTCFWIEIDAPGVAEARPESSETPTQYAEKHQRLLLAEDDPVNRLIIRKILERSGYEVAVACDGEEVLKKLFDGHFDAIVMDWQMPRLDGLECTKRIRGSGDPRLKNIPIVAMTACASEEDKDTCLKAGMDSFLNKPVNCEELQNTLHEVIKKNPARSGILAHH